MKKYIFTGYVKQPFEIVVIASDDEEAWQDAQDLLDVGEWREVGESLAVLNDDYDTESYTYGSEND
jgi:hypothetical protein